ncbi:5-bromo-4-chloroindolyl phosphate hydrolysis family protein (plasmid) [Cytobacillus spongiae]|uniref:5-bromo-4-chloroindolyl phosphate hydrolysis family protein n=1 Tax=Cytobacillus spongiae TaxID=2901381 RepID=UPI001CD7F035|nr:5-bromo-4-chloroindolyl phosphate hydrolysis family protein [Cytobacillus spongiae]MCA1062919.1 5-bromo-4-chloroindolyl phosphate hydrolysis family protein [Rossellomorea aquimaris]UII58522.1 5-bromo-4-chloroindolyl phosphate hydrolysis family protein [Cytobacillus spongiae]WJV28453.1 5-bromo-4-chloroindolyl phosphate hydrolysis family protein [Rossellomorea sp. AcN35-11]
MNTFLQFSVRSVISFIVGTSSFIPYLLLFDIGFPLTFLSSLGTGILVFFITKGIQKRWWLNKNGLSSQEFRYINKNLKEAKEKVKRLQKQQLKVRSLGAFKQILELNRLSRRIYQLVKKEPKRFFSAESFFFYHLDSVVEISEKYTFLAAQPGKNKEAFLSLQQTRTTLDDLTVSLEKDLQNVLANDMDTLQFELNFANQHLSNKKDLK